MLGLSYIFSSIGLVRLLCPMHVILTRSPTDPNIDPSLADMILGPPPKCTYMPPSPQEHILIPYGKISICSNHINIEGTIYETNK